VLDACSSQDDNAAYAYAPETSFLQDLSDSDYSVSEESAVWDHIEPQFDGVGACTLGGGGPAVPDTDPTHFMEDLIMEDLAGLADVW